MDRRRTDLEVAAFAGSPEGSADSFRLRGAARATVVLLSAALLATPACIDGVTPDCSDAGSVCGYDLGDSAVSGEADAPPPIDAADAAASDTSSASDARGADAADASLDGNGAADARAADAG